MKQQQHLSSKTVHVAFVVEDLEAALAELIQVLGVPRPEIKTTPPLEVARPTYLGQASRLGCTQVNFRWGPIGLEIIQPNDEPSVWRDFLEQRGPGLHHIGVVEDSAEEAETVLETGGFEKVQTGHFHGGEYRYFNALSKLGAFFEVLTFEN